jgi:hypothetical protein
VVRIPTDADPTSPKAAQFINGRVVAAIEDILIARASAVTRGIPVLG